MPEEKDEDEIYRCTICHQPVPPGTPGPVIMRTTPQGDPETLRFCWDHDPATYQPMEDLKRHFQEVERLEKVNSRLKTALEQFARRENWQDQTDDGFWAWTASEEPWTQAREALNLAEEKESEA